MASPYQYGSPMNQHGPPLNQHGPPLNQHGPPMNQYGPPTNQHGPPMNQYGPPMNQHGPPTNQYGPPMNQHGPPMNRPPPGRGEFPYPPPVCPPSTNSPSLKLDNIQGDILLVSDTLDTPSHLFKVYSLEPESRRKPRRCISS